MKNIYVRKRSYWTLMGVPFALYGVLIIIDPVYYSGKFEMVMDLNGVNYILGPLLIVVGFVLIWRFMVPKKRHISFFTTMICPQCHSVYIHDGAEHIICTNCGGRLEPIEGFYERHPELKDA